MIGAKNTLTARYSYETGTSTNPGGGNSLTTQASSSSSSDNTIQISDTQLLSDRVINETRFEYRARLEQFHSGESGDLGFRVGILHVPTVPAAGSTSGTSNHIEVQNYTSIQLAKNFVRLGGRLRSGLCHERHEHAPERVADLLVPAGSMHRSQCSRRPSQADCLCTASVRPTPCRVSAAGNNPNNLQLPSVVPVRRSLPVLPDHDQQPYDQRARDRCGLLPGGRLEGQGQPDLSYGLRMEAQNYINSTHDFAPRTVACVRHSAEEREADDHGAARRVRHLLRPV